MKIIVDSREQRGWDFFPHGKAVKGKLGYGDYTTEGLMDICRVERKASTGEIYMNLGRTKNKARFFRELDKLAKLPHPLIVCDFPESDISIFPEKSGIPQWRYPSKREVEAGAPQMVKMNAWGQLKINGVKLLHLIDEVRAVIPIVFCQNRQESQTYVFNLFKELEAKHGLNK